MLDKTRTDSRETSRLALSINQSFLFLAAVICSKAPTADQPVGQKQSFIEFTVEEANEKVLSLYCIRLRNRPLPSSKTLTFKMRLGAQPLL